jgi:hypothetical protein
MENTQPEINRTGNNDIGSPLNTGSKEAPGHVVKKAGEDTNDQDGDVQMNNDVSFSNTGEKPGKVSGDDQSFNGNNDPGANKTPHPGAGDGS